jgi:hypothetical protein
VAGVFARIIKSIVVQNFFSLTKVSIVNNAAGDTLKNEILGKTP